MCMHTPMENTGKRSAMCASIPGRGGRQSMAIHATPGMRSECGIVYAGKLSVMVFSVGPKGHQIADLLLSKYAT